MNNNEGFVYIFSNEDYSGLIKIGISKKEPIIRADQLTKNTGAIGTFKLEWSMAVVSMDIAEKILHFTFRQFHYQKEFFRISVANAIPIATSTLDSFFNIDNKTQTLWKLKERMKEQVLKLNNIDKDNLLKQDIELNNELKKL